MAINKQAVTDRARQIIRENPRWGKNRINNELRTEFHKGLRSATILSLKGEISRENPRLTSEYYSRGGVPARLLDVYNGWKTAGFTPWEARELTIGHGDKFDAHKVYDSVPAQQAREFRMKIIREQRAMGWAPKRIRENIMDFYRRGKDSSPWEHIRAEYKPREQKDFLTYRELVRRRAKAKQKRLLRSYKGK